MALGKNAAGASNAHWALSAVQVCRQKSEEPHFFLSFFPHL